MNINPYWFLKKPIAHRGLHSKNEMVPENSIKSFQKAIEKGFPIELDIHLLNDNQIAVFHDESLKRMCGTDIRINDLDSKKLKQYFLQNTSEKIPLLKEVFELVKGSVPILIEIKSSKKNKGIHEPLIKLINNYTGGVAIQSFNPLFLKWFVNNAPTIMRGQLSGSFKGEGLNFFTKFLLRNYLLNFISKPNFIAHEYEDLSKNNKIFKFRQRGIPILSWTIRNKIDCENALKYCDNIIFESFTP